MNFLKIFKKIKETSTMINGYILFSNQTRPNLIQANPNLNSFEIQKIIQSNWKALSAEEREKYEAEANQENLFQENLEQELSVPESTFDLSFEEAYDLVDEQLAEFKEPSLKENPVMFLQMIEELGGSSAGKFLTKEMMQGFWTILDPRIKEQIIEKLRAKATFF